VPPASVGRDAHAEYFEGDPGWEHPGGSTDVTNSVLRLNTWRDPDATVGLAPESWAMTAGHLKARVRAVTDGDRWQNADLVFDYQDDQNYKFAGLRVGGGRWVIGAMTDGVETILADSTLAPPQANTWYKLGVVVARVVGQDKVTLYANDVERVTWTRGSGQTLTGGRVGVMVRGGAARFGELEQWDVGRVTKTYATGGQRIALRRDNALYFIYTDHLGSSSLLTTETGAAEPSTRLKYYAYGGPRPGSASSTHDAFARGYTPATYTGQTRDASTGLMYYGARFLDPALGIFLAPDSVVPEPGNPAALNRYAYADSNPLKHNDLNGHQANIPSVNGSIGCTGLLGANTVTVANPATQPLTTATYFTQNDVVLGPSSARPDDGVFLMYANPGELRPRSEVVGYAVGLPDNPFVGGGVEERRVTT